MKRLQRFTLTFALAISMIGGRYVAAGPGPQNGAGEEQLKLLVVMIQSFADDRASNGAGIIFGQQGSRLYIVTANHVVRTGVEQAERVKVQFKWIPGEWWDARVLEHEDRELDIAVLSVVGQNLDVPELTWKSWVLPERLTAGDRMRPIGFPRGVPWFIPQQRHLFHSVTPLYIRSEGELDPGNSGGALVTDDWGIVGITSQADRPYNRASRIDRAIEKLVEWGYRVDLTPKDPAPKPGPPRPPLTYEGPRVVKEVQPLYPAETKARRVEGTVELTCVVTINGRASDIKVVRSVDPRLDEAAIEALTQWEFTPAMKFGEPVPARMNIEMTFSLK